MAMKWQNLVDMVNDVGLIAAEAIRNPVVLFAGNYNDMLNMSKLSHEMHKEPEDRNNEKAEMLIALVQSNMKDAHMPLKSSITQQYK